jgi:hypothetical protein
MDGRLLKPWDLKLGSDLVPHIPGKPRPKAWKFQDEFDHQRHRAWHRARAQANFRGEEWQLSIEDWFLFWPTVKAWSERGRSRDDYVLTRIDPEKAWTFENCQRISRLEQLRNKQELKRLSRLYE